MSTSARNWYAESREAIQEIYGQDWELFSGLLACTSPNSTIKANVTLARKAYIQIQDTGTVKPDSFIHTHHKSILRLLKTGKPSGRKCQSLYANLTGKNENVVTVDVWMMRYAGIARKQPTARDYDWIEAKVREEAKDMGIKPCERQAEIWAGIRGSTESYATRLLQYRLL